MLYLNEYQNFCRYFEPMALVTIVAQSDHLPAIDQLCMKARGERIENTFIDQQQCLLKWRIPFVEAITNFFDNLKRISSGYASFDMKDDGPHFLLHKLPEFQVSGYAECKLEKVCIYINDKPPDELSMICPSSRAHANAKRIVEKLKEEIPRQQYEVNISASLGHSKKTIARTLVKPVKKDFAGVMKG